MALVQCQLTRCQVHRNYPKMLGYLVQPTLQIPCLFEICVFINLFGNEKAVRNKAHMKLPLQRQFQPHTMSADNDIAYSK